MVGWLLVGEVVLGFSVSLTLRKGVVLRSCTGMPEGRSRLASSPRIGWLLHAATFAGPSGSGLPGSAPETQTFDADGLAAAPALGTATCSGPEEAATEAHLRFFADSTTDSSTSSRILLGETLCTFPLRSCKSATAGNKLILVGAECLKRGVRGEEGGSGKASIRSTVRIVLVGYETALRWESTPFKVTGERTLDRGIDELWRQVSAFTWSGDTGNGKPLRAARARTEGLTMTLLSDSDEWPCPVAAG